MSLDRLINIIVMATVFGLVFSVWCICVFLWLGQYLTRLKGVRERLGFAKSPENEETRTLRLWRELQQKDNTITSSSKPTIRERIERLRSDAGWKSPVHIVLIKVIAVAVVAFIVTCFASGVILLGFGVFLSILGGFWIYTQKSISKRTELFETQLVSALGIASRALRAGHPLVGAFQLVSEEIDEPLGSVFFQICQEQALGLDLKDSIRKVAKTTHNPELKLFATAVSIQFQSGGNLADLMDSLALVIRARMKLNRRVRVITAQTQFSKNVLIAMPIIMFFVLNIINRKYMDPFYTTIEGKWLLVSIVASLAVGAWVMNRLSVLRY
jgi:tight adherence protein B